MSVACQTESSMYLHKYTQVTSSALTSLTCTNSHRWTCTGRTKESVVFCVCAYSHCKVTLVNKLANTVKLLKVPLVNV